MDKREKERRVKNIKLHLVINLKESTGVDMRDEIIKYIKDRLEEEGGNKNGKKK